MPKVLFASLAALSLLSEPLACAAQGPPPLSVADRKGVSSLLATDEAPQAVAELDDDAFLALALRFAIKESGQRVRPSGINRLWAMEPPRRDIPSEFAAAQAKGQLAAWLASLRPNDKGYARLQAAYRRYEQIVAAGGWTPLSANTTLRPGVRSSTVAALRTRLNLEGYGAAAPADPNLYDDAISTTVAVFQRAHGIAPDGVVGPSTRAALNVAADARLEQIEANLERMRWTPRELPPDRVVVDSGLAEAGLTKNGDTVLTMRVVVGKPSTPTPMFQSRLEAIVLNPPWNVPPQIAANEILPKAARDPSYLTRERFVRTAGGGLQQLPGPKNALGQIKFDLTSPFGVYLHDTPSRSAFAQDKRQLSHGCMRLEKPRELAVALLGWSTDKLSAEIDSRQTRRVAIADPVALFVIHTTAFVDEAGVTNFRADSYGWDHTLARALRGQASVLAQAPQAETDCAAIR